MTLLGEFRNRCDLVVCLLDRRREAEFKGQVHEIDTPIWTPRSPKTLTKREIYVWARVNLVVALGRERGLDVSSPRWLRYLDSHLPAIKKIDAGDPNWTLPDPVYINNSHLTVHRSRTIRNEDRMILERLEAQYPGLCWRIEEVSPVTVIDTYNPYDIATLEGYTKYWACVHVMANCIAVGSSDSYQYFACFTDLFASVPNGDVSDASLDLEQLYPFDNRAFTPYDLPDPTSLMTYISLWGEKLPAPSELIHVIQKSLPFAFQRRKIVYVVQRLLTRSDSFYRLFARLLWCLFAQLYPNQTDHTFDIKRLVAVQRACYDRKRLIEWFSTDKAGSIVTTAIKLWVGMVKLPASTRVDWSAIIASTYEHAEHLIAGADFTAAHPFAAIIAEKPEFKCGPMYRYREVSMVLFLLKRLQRGQVVLSGELKSAILNLLIRVPPELRLHPSVMSALRLPKYGGITDASAEALATACSIYIDSGMPREIKRVLQKITEYSVVCWYLHVVSLLDEITVVPLPTAIANQIDRAMLRHKFSSTYEGQYVNPNVFMVYVSLCCDAIHTLDVPGGYGHADMIWSITDGTVTCSRRNKIQTNLSIPCSGSPVLGIPLRGCMLIWHNAAYLHCPQCGDFHEYSSSNWCGEMGYGCNKCATAPVTVDKGTCFACGIELKPKVLGKYKLQTEHSESATINWMYYCKRHFDAAKLRQRG